MIKIAVKCSVFHGLNIGNISRIVGVTKIAISRGFKNGCIFLNKS